MGKKSTEEKKDVPKTEESKKVKDETKPGAKLDLPEEPTKPNKTELEAATSEVEKEIEVLVAERAKLTEKIEERQVGKPEYEEKRKALQDDFEKARETFDTLRNSLYELTNEVKRNKEAGFNNKKELRSLEKGINNMDEAGIDKKIREVEMRMHTTSMSLQAEKAAMKEIADLKKKRPEVKRMAEKLAALQKDADKAGAAGAPLEEQIQEIKKQIEVAKTAKDAKKDLVTELQNERKEKNGDIKGIIDARDKVRDKIKALQDKKWEKKREYDEIQKKHWQWQKDVRNIKQKAQREREEREWEMWEATQKKKELEKAAEKPYYEEMTLLEQTIDYCKTILKSEGLLKDDSAAAEEQKVNNAGEEAPEGAMVMLSKKDRDSEMYIQGTKGKKGKMKNKEQGGEKKKKNIKHNAGTFALFTKLKVSAPMTVDDVPATLEKLEAEMEVFNGKIAEWETKRKDIEEQIKNADLKLEGSASAATEEAAATA